MARLLRQIVTLRAREHQALKAAGLLGEQRTEPLHPGVIALDVLVVEDDCGLEILPEAEPIQS